MVFCEQKLLWQLVKHRNLSYKFLFDETLICWKDQWIKNGLGLFDKKDEYDYATHFGPNKRRSFDDSDGYYSECKQNVMEVFFKYFPHLSVNILNLLETGYV
jgi:hypothetical protein